MTSELFQRRFKDRTGVISKHGFISTDNSEPAVPLSVMLQKSRLKGTHKSTSSVPQLPKLIVPRHMKQQSQPVCLCVPEARLRVPGSNSSKVFGRLGIRSNSTMAISLLDGRTDKSGDFSNYTMEDEKSLFSRTPARMTDLAHPSVCDDVWNSAMNLRVKRTKATKPSRL